MNYRKSEILDETDLGASGTKVIDINVADPISRITLGWKTTKSKNGMNSYPHKDITKIELADGSDVLYSMSGGQCQALCIYDRKVATMNHGQHINGSSEYASFALDFGRRLFDPLLAFDPSRFRNPQLKVTFDEDVADTGVTANGLEVWADHFDEKVITPIGFLMSKEHFAYTCGAAGSYEYVYLPTDFPIRRMLIQGYYSGYEPWHSIIEAKLSEDNDKRVVFNYDLEDYHRIMKGVWTPVREEIIGIASAGGLTFYVTPTDYWTIVAALTHNNAIDLEISGASIRGGKVTLKSASASQFGGIAFGWLPNHCFDFLFGDPTDIEDWYDVTKVGSLRLRLKAGSAGASGSGAVVLQQLRKY